MEKSFVLINLFGGSRIDIQAEDILKAGAYAVQLCFDTKKDWDAKESKRYKKDEGMTLEGFNVKTGKKMYLILLTKEKADEAQEKELFKDWKYL